MLDQPEAFNFAPFFYVLVVVVLVAGTFLVPIIFRRVVEPNEVHIVQSRRKTIPYGKEQPGGNAYYEWPHWLPIIGVQSRVLPLSVFDIELKGYDAYDVGKVPFEVDVVAFFRIDNPNKAAERVENFEELTDQLRAILQGATRSILAKSDIEEIMKERSKYGDEFTKEVQKHIAEWGVSNVKSIELMDIRDSAAGSHTTIADIMNRKKSEVEKTSRVTVALNMKEAETAEIINKREVDIQAEQARQAVGERQAEADKQIGIANEKAQQEVKTQEKETTERTMAVLRVQTIRDAEIKKDAEIVKAEEQKQTTIIVADGDKQQTVIEATGLRDSEKLRAEAIHAVGSQEADVIRLKETAPVEAQIVLAQEIGENKGYQDYLVNIRGVEAGENVGMEQAKALQQADIRVIANSDKPGNGVTKAMDLFSAKGGTEFAAMAEAFAQTPVGESILKKFNVDRDNDNDDNDNLPSALL